MATNKKRCLIFGWKEDMAILRLIIDRRMCHRMRSISLYEELLETGMFPERSAETLRGHMHKVLIPNLQQNPEIYPTINDCEREELLRGFAETARPKKTRRRDDDTCQSKFVLYNLYTFHSPAICNVKCHIFLHIFWFVDIIPFLLINEVQSSGNR